MAPNTPITQNNAAELHEEAVRICDRMVVAYAMMQEALRRNDSIPSSAPSLLLSAPSKKRRQGLVL